MSESEEIPEGMEKIWARYLNTETPDIPGDDYLDFADDGTVVKQQRKDIKTPRPRPLQRFRPYSVSISKVDVLTGRDRSITAGFTLAEFVPYDVRSGKRPKG